MLFSLPYVILQTGYIWDIELENTVNEVDYKVISVINTQRDIYSN